MRFDVTVALLTERFDGFLAYETELVVLGIGIIAITFIPVVWWLWKNVRAWWAGIVSAVPLLAACIALALRDQYKFKRL
jgi:hypothetical protein